MPQNCYIIYDYVVNMYVYTLEPLTYCSYMNQAHCFTLAEFNAALATLNTPSEPDRFGRPKDRQV